MAARSGKVFGAAVRATSKGKFTSGRAPLVLTQAAVARIKDLMKTQPDSIGLKIGVKTRGCNGLSYFLEYTKEKSKFDEEVHQDGVSVIIDSKALLTLLGTEMDFVQTSLSEQFVFNNPNIKGTCGCGESFTV